MKEEFAMQLYCEVYAITLEQTDGDVNLAAHRATMAKLDFYEAFGR